MKKVTILAITLILSTLAFSQASKNMSEATIDSINTLYLPQKIQGFVAINLGASVTHPRVVGGLSIGGIWKSLEVSASSHFTVHPDNLVLFDIRAGYRMPISPVTSVTTSVGLWTMWNETEPIKWTGGNRLMFSATGRHRVANNLNMLVVWSDYRSFDGGKRTGTTRDKYNAYKQFTIGFELTF